MLVIKYMQEDDISGNILKYKHYALCYVMDLHFFTSYSLSPLKLCLYIFFSSKETSSPSPLTLSLSLSIETFAYFPSSKKFAHLHF